MDKPKRLLYISYYYPPANEIASVRAKSTRKFLQLSGWEVDVLTKSSDLREVFFEEGMPKDFIVKDPISERLYKSEELTCKIFRKLYLELFNDIAYHWCQKAYRQLSKISTNYDIILATGGPFTIYKLAMDLAEKKKIPFVLDYRDLWHGNPHIKRFIYRDELEKKIIDKASMIFTISNSCCKVLAHKFDCGDKITVVTNGYDPEELDRIDHNLRDDKFNIVYTGTFYPPLRVPDPLFKAISLLNQSIRSQIVFNYYGPHGATAKNVASKYGLLDNLIVHGNTSRDKALAAQKAANLVVVISTVNSQSSLAEKGVLTGKVFESIGLRRPILAICPNDSDLSALIIENNFGYAFAGHQECAIASFLETYISSRIEIDGSTNREKFSWPELITVMSQRLRSLVK